MSSTVGIHSLFSPSGTRAQNKFAETTGKGSDKGKLGKSVN